jgi:arylsulfatase A-like enzyme
LAASGLAAAALLAGCGPSRPPNVLLIVLDTARADAVSAYAGAPAATPVLDRLATQGVLFEAARSTSAWTVPAHGSLFTGLYPSRHGADWEHLMLEPERVTLAELLAPTHATAGFSENPHIGERRGFHQGFATFVDAWRSQKLGSDVAPTDRRVLEWLAARDQSRPFFLFVNFMAPHLPYAPPPPFRERFVPAGADPEQVERLAAMNEWSARQYLAGQFTLSAEEIETLRGLYRGEVAFADARVGTLLAALEQEGELDRTLVAVVGDHGENLIEHGLWEHQFCLYETLLRVPLVLRLPGWFEGGRRRAEPVQLPDLAPTILEVAGVPRERWPPMEGLSLASGELPARRPQVAEYGRPVEQRWRFARVDPNFDFSRFDRRLAAVVAGNWKLILSDRGEVELYDLDADPNEQRDRAAEQPDLAAGLRRFLDEWRAKAREPPSGAPTPPLDEETRKALKALGYVE